MKTFKKVLLVTGAVLVSALTAFAEDRFVIDFETTDYAAISTYDWWEASPFRVQPSQTAARINPADYVRVVDNPYAEPDAQTGVAANASSKVLAFQRSRQASNMFGARIDLTAEQRFILNNTTQYVHVLMHKPVNSRAMLIGLGRHNSNTANYSEMWQDQPNDVVQFTMLGNNKPAQGMWSDVVFPIKGAGNIDIYSLVVVVDCEAPHGLDDDFVAYIDKVTLNDRSTPSISLAGNYAISFDPEQVSRSDRYLNSVSIVSGGNTYVKAVEGRKSYTKAFDDFVYATPGSTVQVTGNYQGSAMHSFVYFDKDNNGKFDVPSDLVASNTANGSGCKATNTFTIPSDLAPGVYRLRFKVDWSDTEPAGSMADGNDIIKNGGCILDALFYISPAEGTVSVSNDQRNGEIVQADGTSFSNYTHPVGTPLTVKARPESGFSYAGMTLTYGEIGGEEEVNDNPQYLTKYISYKKFKEDDTYTIPARYLKSDLLITGDMVETANFHPATATFPYVSPEPENGTWSAGTKAYHIKNYSSNHYVTTTAVDDSQNLKLTDAAVPTTDDGLWVVCGDDEDGYRFYNVAAGATKVLGMTGSEGNARMKLYSLDAEGEDITVSGVTTRFFPSANGDKGFVLRMADGSTNCWNYREPYLALWNNASSPTNNGSTFVFSDATELEETPVASEFNYETNSTITISELSALTITFTGESAANVKLSTDKHTAYLTKKAASAQVKAQNGKFNAPRLKAAEAPAGAIEGNITAVAGETGKFSIAFPEESIEAGDYEVSIPAGTFYVGTEDNPVAELKANYTVEESDEPEPVGPTYPFIVSTSTSNLHWHYLQIRGDKYVAYNSATKQFDNSTTAPTTDAGLFAFVQVEGGFKIVNKAAGTDKAIGGTIGNNALVSSVDFASAQVYLYQNNNGHDVFGVASNQNAHLNDINSHLGYWTDAKSATDGGSTFKFFPIEVKVSTDTEKHYYTIRNNNNPSNYAHYDSDNQYLTLGTDLNNSAVFYFTSAGSNANGSQLVNIHNYVAGDAKTMNDWNSWGTSSPRTWYIKLADGTTGQFNDFNIALNSNYANSWNHQNPYVKSWSAGSDRGSGWYIEEVTQKTYTIKIVGSDDNSYTVYNQGNAYHNGDKITGFFFSADNFSQDAAGNQPVKSMVTMEGENIVFSFYEYDTVTGGTRPEDISDYSLWYDVPATKTGVSDQWMEYALPMGNGQLGATIVGGVMTDNIQFNEKTLWEGSTANSGQGYYQNFGSILVKDLGSNFSITNASKPVSNYVRYLDIMNGVAGVNFSSSTGSNYTRRYFTTVGQDDKVFVARYEVDGSDKLNLRFSYAPDGRINASSVTYSNSNNVAEATFKGKLTTVQYNTRFRVLTDGSKEATNEGINVSNATWATVIMAAATDYDVTKTGAVSGATADDIAATVQSRIESAAAKEYASLLSAHTAKQNEYMGRVDFHVGGASSKTTEELVKYYNISDANKNSSDGLFLEQLYFQYGRYMTVAANADQSIHAPSNLQGIWNDRSNTSFWHCDVHADINVEMNYWPADPTNLSEMHLPFLNHILDLSTSTPWTNMAKKVGGSDAPGWAIACENNIFGGSSTWENGSMKTLNAWYCSHLWRYYQYTQDKAFLKKALPAMYSAAQYIKHIARRDDASRGSKWIIPNEWSPEHGEWNKITAFAQQTSAELLDEVLKAHAILGNESTLTSEQAQELQNFYDEFNKGVQIENYSFKRDNVQYTNVPCLSEWMDAPLSDPGHRHLSHLMCVYPFSQITAYGTTQEEKNLFAAAGNAILARNGDVTGWSMGWQTNVYARVLKGNEARGYLSHALRHSTSYVIAMGGQGGCYYNLFDAHSPFQIDGNYGCTSGVAEMLLQSYDGTVHLLPALPDAWANGHINGLKAVGNFQVDQKWAAGALTKATIVNKHSAAQNLTVKYGTTDLTKVEVTLNGAPVTPTAVTGGYQIANVPADGIVVITLVEEEVQPVSVTYELNPASGSTVEKLETIGINFTGEELVMVCPASEMEQEQVYPTLTKDNTTVTATAVVVNDETGLWEMTFPASVTEGEWTLTIPQGTFYGYDESFTLTPVAAITATYTVGSASPEEPTFADEALRLYAQKAGYAGATDNVRKTFLDAINAASLTEDATALMTAMNNYKAATPTTFYEVVEDGRQYNIIGVNSYDQTRRYLYNDGANMKVTLAAPADTKDAAYVWTATVQNGKFTLKNGNGYYLDGVNGLTTTAASACTFTFTKGNKHGRLLLNVDNNKCYETYVESNVGKITIGGDINNDANNPKKWTSQWVLEYADTYSLLPAYTVVVAGTEDTGAGVQVGSAVAVAGKKVYYDANFTPVAAAVAGKEATVNVNTTDRTITVTYSEGASEVEILQDKIDAIVDDIHIGTIGYPDWYSEDLQTVMEYNSNFGDGVTDANYTDALEAYNAFLETDDILLPEDGKAYLLKAVHVNDDGSIKNSYNIYSTPEGQITGKAAAVGDEGYTRFIARRVEGNQFILVNELGRYLCWFDTGDSDKSFTTKGATEAYDATYSPIVLEHATTEHTNNVPAVNALTAEQRFGLFQMKGHPKNASTQYQYFCYDDGNSHRFVSGNSGDKYYNAAGRHTFLFQLVEDESYTYNKPTLAYDEATEAYYATIYLPYPMQMPDGVECYRGVADRGDNLALAQVNADNNNPVPAGGYVLYSTQEYIDMDEESDTYNQRLAKAQVLVTPAAANPEADDTNIFTGSTANGDAGTMWETFLKDNNPYVLAKKATGIGFYRYTGTSYPKGKAIWLGNSNTSESVGMTFDDIVEAIKAAKADENNGIVFDLQGRRLQKAQKGKVNVLNGHKIMFK